MNQNHGHALARVHDALTARGCSGRGTSWQCPAHEDRAPSLSVTHRDGKVLLCCQVGCNNQDILTALGLAWADLFDAKEQPRSATEWVARYEYTDELGTVQFVKERGQPKTFRVYRPVAGGARQYKDVFGGPNPPRRVLYRLPAVVEAVRTGVTVYVVEGEKDVHAAEQAGAIATCNYEGAAKSDQRPKWRPEYGDQLKGAHVVIVADNDEAGHAHAAAIRADLDGKAASVRVVRGLVDAPKADLSDHLAAGHELGDLVDVALSAATRHLHAVPSSTADGRALTVGANALQDEQLAGEVVPPPTNPMAVARLLLEELTADGEYLLRRWRGQWMRYVGPHWAEDEDGAVRKWVYSRLEYAQCEYRNPKTEKVEIKDWNPNRSKVADLLDALAGITHLAHTIDPPSWIDTGEQVGHFIACANGLLDIRDRQLRPATPRYFGTVAVPFDYDATAGEPVEWLKFLRQLWPAPAEQQYADEIRALQEWFGYVLSGRTDLQKILLIVGPPRSGKGTIARVLTALVGPANVAAPTLAGLATNFGLAPLLGRPLAIVGDARLAANGQEQVVERLLSISGEDMLTVDRKNREAWSGRIPARFMILSNELPRFGDASGAIAARFIVLALQESHLGREDVTLVDRLLAELPSILKWGLDGLVRLNERRRFTEPAASAEAVSTLADLVSPISAFIREVCVKGADEEVLVSDLYREYKAWCEENGRGVSSVQKLSTDLRTQIPALKVYRPKVTDDDGTRRSLARHYRGLSINPEWLSREKDPERPWGNPWHR